MLTIGEPEDQSMKSEDEKESDKAATSSKFISMGNCDEALHSFSSDENID